MRKILRQKGPDYTVAQGGWRNKCYLWTYTEPSHEEMRDSDDELD